MSTSSQAPDHGSLINCLHYYVHCPLSFTIPSKPLPSFFIQLQSPVYVCLYVTIGLRKRMLEADCAFVSVTKTCLTQFQKGTSTYPSFGASQSFYLLRESFSESILLTCLFKINTAYYSFCNCVSLSLSPS